MIKFRIAPLIASAAVAAGAQASFVTNIASSDSVGALGNAGNGVSNSVYGGSSAIFSTMNLTGSLTEVNTGTFGNEARWNIRNSTFGTSLNFQSTTTGNFTGTLPINANASLLAWANSGDNFRFESWESFDDSGIDARWSDTRFTFDNEVVCTDLGDYPVGTAFVLDTETSTFDTELALYEADGTLLAADDDSGSGLLSLINAGVLAAGDYILVAGGFDSQFVSGFALAGTATGTMNVRINGATVSSAALAPGALQTFCFSVPEPSALVLLGLGAVAAFRRR